jgi:hypothetical protein
MIITLDIRFIDYLFKCLWETATLNQIPPKHRLKALGTLSESAVFYYRECDNIIDLVYEQCSALMQDPEFACEAAIILWLMFRYYKEKIGTKRALKKTAIASCLKTFQLILELGSNLSDWISALESLLLFKIEKKRVLYDKYSQKLLHIVTGKYEPKHCIEAFGLLMDLLKGLQVKSDIILRQCLNPLRDLVFAEGTTTSPILQLSGIQSIMVHYGVLSDYTEVADQGFDKLFDFLDHPDIAVMIATWDVLWNMLSRISGNNSFPAIEKLGNQFVQQILNTMADQDLELGLRLKAIEFMMLKFKQDTYGLTKGEAHSKSYLYLLELVKTEQFLSSDYLESLRLYFKVMNSYNYAKKIRSILPSFASANASNA